MLHSAAKQEAFEESIRLKNQFRTLDEDEVEFLDSVLESTRAKEDAVKKETTEQLELFRRQREEVDKALLGDTWTEPVASHRPDSPSEPHLAESQWTINARKRKRARDNEVVPGIKLRKSSSTSKEPTSALPGGTAAPAGEISPKDTSPPGKTNGLGDNPQDPVHGEGSFLGGKQTTLPSASAKPKIGALGLAAYSSDEDD